MKILHISKSDDRGGAARAARRIHESLLSKGMDSIMLVDEKYTKDKKIYFNSKNKMNFLISRLKSAIDIIILKILHPSKKKIKFSIPLLSNKFIERKILEINPDIVHLHWINGGTLNKKFFLNKNFKLVQTLHDMEPITGGCHYSGKCNKFKKICYACHVLSSNQKKDLSYKIFSNKKKLYKDINLKFIASSKWIFQEAIKGSLVENKNNIYFSENPINIKKYKKINKNRFRSKFNLPINKLLIFFGSVDLKSDPRKGFSFIQNYLLMFENKNCEFVVAGTTKNIFKNFRTKVNYIKFLNEDDLKQLYQSIDIFISPSVEENLSCMIIENLACGNPVLAFDIGGNATLIKHKINGYLSKPFEEKDFTLGINFIIRNYKNLSINAERYVKKNLNYSIIANKHVNIYAKIINEKIN